MLPLYSGITQTSLPEKPSLDSLPQLIMIASLAVVRTIKKVGGIDTQIKWPNDVLLARKKVAGILGGDGAEVDRLHYIVLGVGINVNTKVSMFPRDIRHIATSIAEQCGSPVSRVKLLQALFERVPAGVLPQHKRALLQADVLRPHDLVSLGGAQHAVLVYAGLVSERVPAHDRLIGLGAECDDTALPVLTGPQV
jgi:BirA family biotin operon repressor/biotin-[acetyl-CoA-carboxylase] ligase